MTRENAGRFLDRAQTDPRIRAAVHKYIQTQSVFPVLDLSRETGDFFSKTEFIEEYKARFGDLPAPTPDEYTAPDTPEDVDPPANDAEKFIRLAKTNNEVRIALLSFDTTYSMDAVFVAAQRHHLHFSTAEFLEAREGRYAASSPSTRDDFSDRHTFRGESVDYFLHPENAGFVDGVSRNLVLRHSEPRAWSYLMWAGMAAFIMFWGNDSSDILTALTPTGMFVLIGIVTAFRTKYRGTTYINQGTLVEGSVSKVDSGIEFGRRGFQYTVQIQVSFENPKYPKMCIGTIQCHDFDLRWRLPNYAARVAVFYVDDDHWWLL